MKAFWYRTVGSYEREQIPRPPNYSVYQFFSPDGDYLGPIDGVDVQVYEWDWHYETYGVFTNKAGSKIFVKNDTKWILKTNGSEVVISVSDNASLTKIKALADTMLILSSGPSQS